MPKNDGRQGYEPASTQFIERAQFDLLEERYRALRGVVKEADLHTTDAAARMVLRFVYDTATSIIDALASHRGPQRPDHEPFLPLDLQQLASIHRRLTGVMSHVKPSPIPVPGEVVRSFRRIVRNLVKHSELLITVGDGSTFTVTEFLHEELGSIVQDLAALGIGYKGAQLQHIVHVRISSVDVTQVLLHCIFAHEFGHAICKTPPPNFTAESFEELPPESRETAARIGNAWRLEIVADLFAMFLFGPAYVCAAVYYISSLYTMHSATPNHPPFALRLRILIEALNDNSRLPIVSDEEEAVLASPPWLPNTQAALSHWLMKAKSGRKFASEESELPAEILHAVVDAISNVRDVIMPLRRFAKNLASLHEAETDPPVYTPLLYDTEVKDLVRAINFNVIPVEQYVDGLPRYVTTASILNAAWECFLGGLKEFSRHLRGDVSRPKVFRLFNEFLLKSLELAEVTREWNEISMQEDAHEIEALADPLEESDGSSMRSGSVLSATTIRKIATRSGLGTEGWLAITPVLRWDRQAKAGNSSIDVRLGQRFRVPQRTRIDSLDHISPEHQRNIDSYFDDHLVPVGSYFILHPRQFVLGVTLEWLRLPPHLCATVIGRSAWGRDGLIVATATTVHPRYAGVLTLELTNVGEIPIRLYPGLAIAQLVIQHVDGASAAQGNVAFMLSAYPRSADAARDDRRIIQRFARDRAAQEPDIVTGD
jgi:dCTP deaminase